MIRPCFILCGVLLLWSYTPSHALDFDWQYQQVDCTVRIPHGYDAICGVLTVPENRSVQTERTLDLAVMRVFSTSRQPAADPLLYITGGPGSALLTNVRNMVNLGPLDGFLEARDMIFMDTRGTGESTPTLYCMDAFDIEDLYGANDSSDAYQDAFLSGMQACRDELVASGLDLSAYRTTETAADIEALRQALGIQTWNLMGVSYGSKVALTVARDYPTPIRSLILDAVYPLEVNILRDYMINAEQAFAALFAACEVQTRCARLYGDLRASFYEVYERLNADPFEARIYTRRYGSMTVTFTGTRMYQWAFSWLYQPHLIRELPYHIQSMQRGDYEEFIYRSVRGAGSGSNGLYWAVQCNEEYAFASDEDLQAVLNSYAHLSEVISSASMMGLIDPICDVWGAAEPDAIDNMPVISDVPALLLTGQFDPITPLAWAQQGASGLSNSYVYEIPAVGHSAVFWSDCGAEIALQFVDAPQQAPDTACIAATQPLRFEPPRR